MFELNCVSVWNCEKFFETVKWNSLCGLYGDREIRGKWLGFTLIHNLIRTCHFHHFYLRMVSVRQGTWRHSIIFTLKVLYVAPLFVCLFVCLFVAVSCIGDSEWLLWPYTTVACGWVKIKKWVMGLGKDSTNLIKIFVEIDLTHDLNCRSETEFHCS